MPTKTLQINYYIFGDENPVIITIRSEFQDDSHAQRWSETLQTILRTHQTLHHEGASKPVTVRVLDDRAPKPRSKPPKQIESGKMPQVVDILEQALAA